MWYGYSLKWSERLQTITGPLGGEGETHPPVIAIACSKQNIFGCIAYVFYRGGGVNVSQTNLTKGPVQLCIY